MRTIIAGSRTINDDTLLQEIIAEWPHRITQVISGTARGVDILGELWAEEHGIEVVRMPADWNKWGKSAGYRRNEDMAKVADAAIIIHDGKSAGTKHMLDIARKMGLEIMYVVLAAPKYTYYPAVGEHGYIKNLDETVNDTDDIPF